MRQRKQRGVVDIDQVEIPKDGVIYKIRFNKETSKFHSNDPLDQHGRLESKDLNELKEEIKKRHAQSTESNYKLKIAVRGGGDFHYRQRGFSLDNFKFFVVYVWKVNSNITNTKQAEFWDGESEWVGGGAHWRHYPYAADDQIRMSQHKGDDIYSDDILLDYTWDRYQVLTTLREKLAEVRESLGEMFGREDLDSYLDSIAGKGIPLLTSPEPKKPKLKDESE